MVGPQMQRGQHAAPSFFGPINPRSTTPYLTPATMNHPFENQVNQFLTVGEKAKCTFIKMETVAYIELSTPLTFLHLTNGESCQSFRTMKDFETQLSAYGLVRLNRTILVNMLHITKISFTGKTRCVTVNGKNTLDVSRRKAHLIIKLFYGKKEHV